MTAPLPPPGWYLDPRGANAQRYFDGTQWTDRVAQQPQPPLPPPRRFVIMAIAGPLTALVTFILMQLAFGAGSHEGSWTQSLQMLGFVFFVLWLASIVATIVGIIALIVRSVRQP